MTRMTKRHPKLGYPYDPDEVTCGCFLPAAPRWWTGRATQPAAPAAPPQEPAPPAAEGRGGIAEEDEADNVV